MRIEIAKPLALCAAIALFGSAPIANAHDQERGWAAYEKGDYALAAELIRPYAEQGDPEAQFKLGRMYQEGQGVSKDQAEAVKWYRLSAEAGQPFAQNNLGVMYKNGWGVTQDYVQAYFWFSLAASYYFDFEEMNLERARQNRQAVAAKITPAEIAAAQKLARGLDSQSLRPRSFHQVDGALRGRRRTG